VNRQRLVELWCRRQTEKTGALEYGKEGIYSRRPLPGDNQWRHSRLQQRSVVDCRACELATALWLFVVTCFKSKINPIINLNPMSSVISRDNFSSFFQWPKFRHFFHPLHYTSLPTGSAVTFSFFYSLHIYLFTIFCPFICFFLYYFPFRFYFPIYSFILCPCLLPPQFSAVFPLFLSFFVIFLFIVLYISFFPLCGLLSSFR
jgi:hypothetical protein